MHETLSLHDTKCTSHIHNSLYGLNNFSISFIDLASYMPSNFSISFIDLASYMPPNFAQTSSAKFCLRCVFVLSEVLTSALSKFKFYCVQYSTVYGTQNYDNCIGKYLSCSTLRIKCVVKKSVLASVASIRMFDKR